MLSGATPFSLLSRKHEKIRAENGAVFSFKDWLEEEN